MQNLGQSVPLKNSRIRREAFEIPSDGSYIRKVSDRVVRIVKRFSVDEPVIFDIRLCIEEALRNAIVHGNRSNPNLPVRIRYSVDREKFEMEVEDRGRGFDHRKVPDPTEGENVLKLGGRGVYLIKYLMDKVIFNEKGNRIRIVKCLQGGSAHEHKVR